MPAPRRSRPLFGLRRAAHCSNPSARTLLSFMDVSITSPAIGSITLGQPTGISVIGFEGLRLETPKLESLLARVHTDPATSGRGLVPVLESAVEMGGLPPEASLAGLRNAHGSPDRIDELARAMMRKTVSNLDTFAAEPDVAPLSEVSAEALQMLDEYLNRTDELDPLSHLLLAQATTEVGERWPLYGEKVSLVDPPAGRSPALQAVSQRLGEAAQYAGQNQVEIHEARVAAFHRVSAGLGWESRRGVLLDQQI